MNDTQVEKILQNAKFKQMVASKSKLSWSLTLVMLVVYVGFILLVGYNKDFLMKTLGDDQIITIGIPMGIGIIVLSFILCGIYSYIANNQLDKLSTEALNEVDSITHDK